MKTGLAIILCGGGVMGAYQAGFLYKLFTTPKYMEYYKIELINGTSIGAINGYHCASGNAESLRDLWLNNSIDNFLTYSCSYPLIGKYLSYLQAITKLSIYQPNYELLFEKLKIKDDNILDKFNFTVTCYNTGEECYINGQDNDLKEYLKASIATFGLPPVIINNKTYFDGGLFENMPINFDPKKFDGTVIILDTDSKIIDDAELPNPSNIITYGINVINMERKRIMAYEFFDRINEHSSNPKFNSPCWLEKCDNVVRLYYKPKTKEDEFTDIFDNDKRKVVLAFEQGEKDAEINLAK